MNADDAEPERTPARSCRLLLLAFALLAATLLGNLAAVPFGGVRLGRPEV